ncbi:ninein-like protein isoform X3 [Ascaphus truei]|uniref:ninein-like protein isoform X3 n=1 Tax=Ascaphus truei TaxID=8439 RepID=UPI003F5A5F92
MDKEEENRYVSQLQDVFNSCDTTGTGYLDKEELTDLCHKLHLEEQLSLLLQTLLGSDHFARVNFDEFKEGFVAVLSSTIDISISEDESSYLEPVIPDEVKPKFVKGHKRYGRRTQPELEAAENETNKFLQEQHHHVKSKRKSQLKRSSSLESVESLKSDEEAECAKEPQDENFEAQGQLRTWNSDIFDSPRRNSSPCSDMTEHQVRDIWEELGIGHNGYLNQQELATVCKNIGLKDLSKEELEDLFHKLDRDGDGRVSFEEFQVGLFCHAPLPISSTPLKQRRPRSLSQHLEDSSRRTTTPSLVSACGGLHLFSSVDDGSGFVTPEQIMAIWEEEGIENGKDILMSLDFSLEEQVNLVEFTTALDNELIATKNRIHLAALASYKHELHHRHGQIDQITKERDKVKLDLERAEKRTLELANEVDDHNSVMESLNESKIKDMEQDYRHKVLVIRSELESEREQIMQQTDQHATKLEADLHNLQVEESFLKEKLNVSVKENGRLQKEMVEIVGKLYESESQVLKLQMDVDKRPTDPQHSELFNQEEKFAEIINEYEAQCRDLRDRNDELQIQLETMRSQLNESKYTRLLAKMKDNKALHLKAKEKIHHNHLTNDAHAKKAMYTKRRSLSSAGANVGLGAVESESSPMNMDAELTKHQLKEQQQEVQDLRIQLETKVNYYEREIELMKANFEEERKDTEQRFKMEVSEVEDQKADLEELNAKYQEVIDGLKEQLPTSAHYQELEKRFEKERAKMEQSHAKEMASLRQRLTSDNEQLEEELKRSHQNELQAMREEKEEELNHNLTEVEAQYAEYCQSLLQQHHSEKNEMLQKYEGDKETLTKEHLSERTQWEEKETALMTQWKKERLKLEEKQNEEQALLCKTFAVEKERMENHYRMHVDELCKEIEGLNACLMEGKRGACTMENTEREEQEALVKGPIDCIKDTLGDLNKQPVSQSASVMEASAGRVCATDRVQVNTQEMDCSDNMAESVIKEKDMLIETHVKQIKDQIIQYHQVVSSLKAAEERLSVLKKAEESATLKLQEMESLVPSLRAQLQAETKAKEMLLRKQTDFDVEEAQLSSQLNTKREECLLSDAAGQGCVSQLQESGDCILKQDLRVQPLTREKEELEKQVALLAEQAVELERKLHLMRENEQELAGKELGMRQNACKSQQGVVHVENIDLVEELLARNALLCQQMRSKEEELGVLQREMEEAISRLQQKEEEATNQVQNSSEALETEKTSLKDKLLELEDLVRELERETRASQDDRKQVEDLKMEKVKAVSDLELLNKQIQKHRDEMCQLNAQSLQLSGTVSDVSAQNVGYQDSIQQLTSRLEEVTQQKGEEAAAAEQLQEMLNALEREKLQQQSVWQREREQLGHELQMSKEEIQQHRYELCQLNAQSLQLSGTVSDLSAQNVRCQETIQQLTSRLKEVTQQKEEEAAAVEPLQEMLNALEREKLQQHSVWQREREQLGHELQMSKEEIQKHRDELCQLNAQSLQLSGTVSDVSAQNVGYQDSIRQLTSRLKAVTQQKGEEAAAAEQLQEMLNALEREKLQQQSVWQREREQLGHELQMSKEEVESLILQHQREKEEQLRELNESNNQVFIMEALQEQVAALKREKQSLEDEGQSITKQLEETADQIHELESDLKQTHEECQTLRRNQVQLREELEESQDQLLEANTKLTLAQSQHMREVQHLKEKLGSAVSKEQLSPLQNRLLEEQHKVQQLQEKLRFHAEQTNRQLAMQQEEHVKLLRRIEERMEDVEMNLKNVRVMLQEKVNQLKEQLEKNAKSDLLLKDLYVENSQLMKALQVTEQRQKSAEKKNYVLEDKIAALNKVIRKIAPASLAV